MGTKKVIVPAKRVTKSTALAANVAQHGPAMNTSRTYAQVAASPPPHRRSPAAAPGSSNAPNIVSRSGGDPLDSSDSGNESLDHKSSLNSSGSEYETESESSVTSSEEDEDELDRGKDMVCICYGRSLQCQANSYIFQIAHHRSPPAVLADSDDEAAVSESAGSRSRSASSASSAASLAAFALEEEESGDEAPVADVFGEPVEIDVPPQGSLDALAEDTVSFSLFCASIQYTHANNVPER